MDEDPRTVKPRARIYPRRPVIAIDDDGNWIGENGIAGSTSDLFLRLHEYPPTIFVKQGAADFVAKLDQTYRLSHKDSWQWRVTEQERAIIRPGGFKAATRVTTTVHFFGFKHGSGKRHKAGNYHKILDPVTMYGQGLATVWPGNEPIIARLLEWGTAIRDFCDENGLDVRPTIGSLGAQFLTDRRFYPHARRKVPWAINARARQELPGNHYALYVHPSPRREFTAQYLDQHRAHHYHARTTALPDADSLYAHGYFVNLAKPIWDEIPDDFYGLLSLDLEAPQRGRYNFLQSGTRFVWTNEVTLLRDLGYRILGIRAAWGSNKRDEGITRYARYAGMQLDRFDDAPWLKPILLATYGTLATRATWGETVFKLAKKGMPVSLCTGHHSLDGMLIRAPRKLEPKIANVIHRGMIEAATRADSIGLADFLTTAGYRVLSIYADAVMVEHDDDLPPIPVLPEPWRVKRTLNHLQFINKQAFMSGEMTKLPGVGQELKAYALSSNTKKAPRQAIDTLGIRYNPFGRKK